MPGISVTKDGLCASGRPGAAWDTPGRTLCPLAGGDTSDLCQAARILLHGWTISRDGARPRAGSVIKEFYIR